MGSLEDMLSEADGMLAALPPQAMAGKPETANIMQDNTNQPGEQTPQQRSSGVTAAAQAYVEQSPWSAMAIGAVAGLLLGVVAVKYVAVHRS